MRCDRPKVPSLNVTALRRRPHGKFAVCLATLTENFDGDSDSDWARRCCLLILALRHGDGQQTHALSAEFRSVFAISSCSCYSSTELCTHHLVCPTAPHTTHTDVGLQFASSFFRSSLSRQFARFTLLLSTLSLCLVGVLFIHVFSTYLRHSYSHCTTTVCVSFYPCACALCPCLCVDSPCCCYCWRPWLKSRSPAFAYHITPFSFSFSCFIYAQACVYVCVRVKDWEWALLLIFVAITLSTFSLEDNTPQTLRAFSSLLSFSFCFF